MQTRRNISIKNILRLQFFLTTIEFLVVGSFLLFPPMLEAGTFFERYLRSRLFLIGAWFFGVVLLSTGAGIIFGKRSVFYSTRNFLSQRFQSKHGYEQLRDWLFVLALFSWGILALFFYVPDFLPFVWESDGFLFLLSEYWFILLCIGFWSLQSLIFLSILKPIEFSSSNSHPPVVAKGIVVFLLIFVVYVYTDISLGLISQPKIAYFPELAEAFLNGRLDLATPRSTNDLTLFNGKYYLSFPPLAALMMMPVVALQGVREVNTMLFNAFFASLGVMVVFFMLEALKKRGWSRLRWQDNVILAFFLGLSTAQYYFAARGIVYFTSQILATTFSSLALWITLSRSEQNEKRNAFFAGSALALAMLARPNVGIILVALAAIQIQIWHDAGEFSLQRLFRWSTYAFIPIAIAVSTLFWYNQVRFGSVFDFGYTYMLVGDYLKADLQKFGQFHPHFIWENIYDNFLRLPYWDANCQKLVSDPNGMSILITSPLIIYLYAAFRKKIWVVGSWLSLAGLILLHAFYFNSGALQYGYRFSLDFMPLVLLLLAFGFKDKLPKLAYFLVAFGIVVNYIGVLWITHRWCVNF